MCDQQRLRPACAYPQSDQSLCKSLEHSMNVQLLAEHHLEFLSLKGGCRGSSESTHVKMPHCWKSSVMAHIKITEGHLDLKICLTQPHKKIRLIQIMFAFAVRSKGEHYQWQCPFIDTVCDFCSKTGHIIRACKAKHQ